MNGLLHRVKTVQDGFLSAEDVKIVAQHDPHRMILVRCGNGRFLAPAQNVLHFAGIIDREDSDYVRDYSLPTTDPIFQQ
jgi:hypothetical protein